MTNLFNQNIARLGISPMAIGIQKKFLAIFALLSLQLRNLLNSVFHLSFQGFIFKKGKTIT